MPYLCDMFMFLENCSSWCSAPPVGPPGGAQPAPPPGAVGVAPGAIALPQQPHQPPELPSESVGFEELPQLTLCSIGMMP